MSKKCYGNLWAGDSVGTQGKTVTTQQLSGKKAFLYCYYMVLWWCIGGGGSPLSSLREKHQQHYWGCWDGSSEFRIGDGVWLSAFWGGSMEYYFLCSEIVVVVEKKERVPSIWATRNLFIWAVESFKNFTILVEKASWGGLGRVSKDL